MVQLRPHWRCVVVAITATVVALGMTGCGGDSSSPAAPTEISPASPTILSVELTGTTTLTTIGETAQLSLVATFSDDSTRVIEPALVEWRSSDPIVATVTEGLVTAVRAGQATITAAYETHRAELVISAQASTHSQGSVRVLYVAPANREFRSEYSRGIATAIVDVQSWYRRQLDGGVTFAIYSVTPEWCQLPRDDGYYSHGDVWEKVLRDVQSCAPVRGNTSRFSWVLYIDAYEACGEPHEFGRGELGLTMMARWDLEGLANPGVYYYCDEGPYDGSLGRWFGGLAHELGHTFGLPHPAGDPRALMSNGYSEYPNTYLRDDEKDVLRRLPFFGRN